MVEQMTSTCEVGVILYTGVEVVSLYYSDVDFCASKSNYSRSMGIVINIEESPVSV